MRENFTQDRLDVRAYTQHILHRKLPRKLRSLEYNKPFCTTRVTCKFALRVFRAKSLPQRSNFERRSFAAAVTYLRKHFYKRLMFPHAIYYLHTPYSVPLDASMNLFDLQLDHRYRVYAFRTTNMLHWCKNERMGAFNNYRSTPKSRGGRNLT